MSPIYRALVCFVCFASSMARAETDAPDLRKEKHFFQIYSHFNQDPTADDVWMAATDGKSQSYSIQEGDTLWEVSETLFGDASFWPKVWSLNNEEIENPHVILPHQEVKFNAGTMGEAPTLAVGSETPPPPGEIPAAGVVAEPTKDPLLDTPLPEPKKIHPPFAELPGSLPRWTYRKDRRQEIIMDIHKANRNFKAPDEFLTYFVVDQEKKSIGSIEETEMGLSSASEFQYVFVRLAQPPSEMKMLVFRNTEKVDDSESGQQALVVQIQGELEILGPVSDDKSLYRALVKRVLSPIEVGAKVMSGELPLYNAKDEGAGSATARIIGGQFTSKRQIFGPSNLVYLVGHGMSEGQSLPIYKVQSLRVENSKGTQGHRMIGKVKIVKISQNFATGVVLKADEDIRVGDVTSPVMQAVIPVKTTEDDASLSPAEEDKELNLE